MTLSIGVVLCSVSRLVCGTPGVYTIILPLFASMTKILASPPRSTLSKIAEKCAGLIARKMAPMTSLLFLLMMVRTMPMFS